MSGETHPPDCTCAVSESDRYIVYLFDRVTGEEVPLFVIGDQHEGYFMSVVGVDQDEVLPDYEHANTAVVNTLYFSRNGAKE